MLQVKTRFDVSIEEGFDFSSNDYARLFAGSSATAFQHPIWLEMNAYAVALTAPFEAWRSSALDRSYQKELAKKFRQLQKKGELAFSCEDRSSVVATLEMMKQYRGPRFHAQGDGDLLQRPEY